MPPPMQMN